MKFNNQFQTIMRLDLENGNIPFLAGDPGIGKSSIVRSLAEDTNSEVFVVMCNQMADKSDLTGARLMPTDDGSYEQRFFPHHKVKAAVSYAKANPRDWVYLLLDEINRTTPDVTSASLTLATERELGDVKLPDNVKIIVAGNIKGNVTTLDEASLSRFSIYQVEPDAHTLMDYLGDSLNHFVRKVLTDHPNLVFERAKPTVFAVDGNDDDDDDDTMTTFESLADAGEDMLQLTTPRTIEYASSWLNSAENLDPNYLREIAQTQVTVGDVNAGLGRDISLLQETLEAKLGNTDFMTFLVSEVTNSLASGQSSAPQGTRVPKPNCYASLKNVNTVDELEDLIGLLTDNEKSGSLLYSLFENEDNTLLVQHLAPSTGVFQPDHMSKLVQLMATHEVDDQNLQTLFGTGSAIGTSVQQVANSLNY